MSQNENKEKSLSDRAKEVGRDGAYLEVDAPNLVKSFLSGDLEKSKIIVIKNSATSLSGEATSKLIQIVESEINKRKTDPYSDVDGMSDEQLSNHVIRKILLTGIDIAGFDH